MKSTCVSTSQRITRRVEAADERRADAVRVDGCARRLELADLLDREAPRGDDLHALEAVSVERLAHLPYQPLVHSRGLEITELLPEGTVDEHLRRVEANAPQARAERACDV